MRRSSGGASYYCFYAHVYGPKGADSVDIADAVTNKKDHPSMNVPEGSGSFEYNAEQIRKDNSSVCDEALKKAGVISVALGHNAVNPDSVWPENMGTYKITKKK